jgi:hypothetical protein
MDVGISKRELQIVRDQNRQKGRQMASSNPKAGCQLDDLSGIITRGIRDA